LSERDDAGAAIGTPWGNASELRQRRLYPGGGTPPDAVARNQRERLFGAIFAVTSQKGYQETTVADVLALSGVSRSAFYKHFSSKSECLAAAASELLQPAAWVLDATATVAERRPTRDLFEGFFRLLSTEPAAARVCFVELHAAGPEGEEVADRALEALAVEIEAIGGGPAGDGNQSPELVRTLVGGVRKLIHTRLNRGEEAGLSELAPDLWRWLMSIVPPPGELESPRRQRPAAGPGFAGYTPAR
jgi:AcrR family transcriptional regulator